jgi:hypothetical protein
MENKSAEKQIEELMPRLSLTVIIAATIVGFVFAIIVDAGLESFNKILIVCAMLLASIIDVFIARFVSLPAMARDANTPRPNLFTVAYSQTALPAAAALIVPIFVNEWWVAPVFGALGVVFWLIIRDYLAHLPVNAGQAQS